MKGSAMGAAMKSRLPRLLLVAFIIFPLCSQFLQAQTWTLLGPPSRHSHSAVWDPTSAQMIIFGGLETFTNTDLNDVWVGKTSTTLSDNFSSMVPTGTAPQGRYGHVATYDSISNRMTVFGGGLGAPGPCANDVWILDGANGRSGTPNWIAVTPSGTAPVARIYSSGAYDPNSNSLIVFGGSDCSTGYFNDIWVLSNANGETGSSAWTQLTPAGTPPPARQSGSVVYDSINNVLTVYGGDAGGSPFGDVWTLSNANGTGGTPAWTQLTPAGTAPMARTGQTATYDKTNNRMTIFGGIVSGITLTDAWVLTFANGMGGTPAWSLIPTQGTAPSVAYHSAVYDSKLDNLYVFAGTSSAGKLTTNDHAFALQGANGISSRGFKWFLGGPPVRYSHAAFYDSVTNGLFVFAGAHSGTLLFNDYWEASNVIGSSNLTWIQLLPKGTKPSPRFGHTGLYDSTSNRLMVFGGGTSSACFNDYHVLQNANTKGGTMTWVSVVPTGTAPGVRMRQASAYDASTNALIIFGGFNCKSTYYNDVWILSNANDLTATPSWTQLATLGTKPSVRQSSSAIYDSSSNSLIVYGGDKGGSPTGDIWILSHANGTGGTPIWTQLTPTNNGPVARTGHTATYDAANNLMTIYAGFDGTNLLSDTWVLSGANGTGTATWTQLVSGQAIHFHSSAYDPVSNQLITYGGATGIKPLNPSSDIYTLTHGNGLK
jgi:hypothetical protein